MKSVKSIMLRTFNAEPPEDSNSEWTLFTMQQQYSFLSIYEDCPRRVRAIFYILTAYSLPTWTKRKGETSPDPSWNCKFMDNIFLVQQYRHLHRVLMKNFEHSLYWVLVRGFQNIVYLVYPLSGGSNFCISGID